MTSQQSALIRLARLLDRLHVPYVIVGGLANIVWGEPRATLDIDVLVWVAPQSLAHVVEELAAEFKPLVAEPLPFIESTRVLPVVSPEQVQADVIFGLLAFEQEVVRHGEAIAVEGVPIRFCTAEDLVLMKIASEREKDLSDARAIVVRRFASLDFAYLEPRVAELASLLDRPEIIRHWHEWTAEGRRGSTEG